MYPSEPVFVPEPNAAAEDGGVILSVVLTPRQVSLLHCLLRFNLHTAAAESVSQHPLEDAAVDAVCRFPCVSPSYLNQLAGARCTAHSTTGRCLTLPALLVSEPRHFPARSGCQELHGAGPSTSPCPDSLWLPWHFRPTLTEVLLGSGCAHEGREEEPAAKRFLSESVWCACRYLSMRLLCSLSSFHPLAWRRVCRSRAPLACLPHFLLHPSCSSFPH